jgi:hypothetical protein
MLARAPYASDFDVAFASYTHTYTRSGQAARWGAATAFRALVSAALAAAYEARTGPASSIPRVFAYRGLILAESLANTGVGTMEASINS